MPIDHAATRAKHLRKIATAQANLLRAQDDLDTAVRNARNSLVVSWDAIGYALGSISRQAAQQRFANIGADQPLK